MAVNKTETPSFEWLLWCILSTLLLAVYSNIQMPSFKITLNKVQ